EISHERLVHERGAVAVDDAQIRPEEVVDPLLLVLWGAITGRGREVVLDALACPPSERRGLEELLEAMRVGTHLWRVEREERVTLVRGEVGPVPRRTALVRVRSRELEPVVRRHRHHGREVVEAEHPWHIGVARGGY